MKVKEIHVEATFVKNLGNYQTYKPTAAITLIIEPGDSVEEAYKKAWDVCHEEIFKQLKAFDEDKPGYIKKGF